MAEAALMQDVHEGGLVMLGEAWAGEAGDGELLQSGLRWLGLIVLLHAGATQRVDESAHDADGGVEEETTLSHQAGLRSVPRVLVKRGDERLVDADEAALGEWRLEMFVSGL